MDLPRLASIQKRLLSWHELCNELASTHPLESQFRDILERAKIASLTLWEKKGADEESERALLQSIVDLEKLAEEVRVQAVAHTPLKKSHGGAEKIHEHH